MHTQTLLKGKIGLKVKIRTFVFECCYEIFSYDVTLSSIVPLMQRVLHIKMSLSDTFITEKKETFFRLSEKPSTK